MEDKGEEDCIFAHFEVQKEERKRRLAAKDDRLHRAVIQQDVKKVKKLLPELSQDDINARDQYGNPALHLAVHLQNIEIINLLLNAGADLSWKNGGGWTIIQEAIAGKNVDLIAGLLNQVKIDVNTKFEERIPQAIRALRQLPDFYMEINWSFGSWVPLVSKFCPYDNYRIWKKGSCVRVDTTLIGFENLKWIRGNISFIFSETLNHPLDDENNISSHVVIINHDKKKVEFALESFKRYSLGNSEKHDLRQMVQNPMVRMQLKYDNITFSRCKNWLGYNKTESVGKWNNASVFDVSGIERKTTKRSTSDRRSPIEPATEEERAVNCGDYYSQCIDEENPKGNGVLHCYERKSSSSKLHKAKVWITKDFPVTIEDLLPMFAILSPNGKHFEKLKDFLSVPLPEEGFPVKIEVPVFPTIYGTATFGVFDNAAIIDDSVFTIPEEYEILEQNSMLFSSKPPKTEKQLEKEQKQLEKVAGLLRSKKREPMGLELSMPIQSVEELRYIKHNLDKHYGRYHEKVVSAEYVQVKSSKGKLKNRLLVVGKHRLYTFRKSRLHSDMATDNHWYDMVEFNHQQNNNLIIRFRKTKQTLSQLDICSTNMQIIIQAICSAYANVTLGYNEELCCKFLFHSEEDLLPLITPQEELIAGGIIAAYEAQACYFQVYFSQDIVRLLESFYNKGSFDLDLTECPLVEDPKVMLPLIGALRHNTYFLSLKLTECQGNQQVLLMIANVLRFNTTLTKLELSNIESPGSYEVVGSSLKANASHAIQIIDLSHNKIPSRAMESISEALSVFQHSLQGLRLSKCQLSLKSLKFLFSAFKTNYGMSLTIQQLDLSHNHLGGRGSVLLGNWLNRIREDSNLEYLYLRNTSIAFIFIGRALVHYPNLRSLDLSRNKLDLASVQLLTLWIETSMSLQSLNISDCNLTGEFTGKILSVLLSNGNLSKVHVHLSHNDLKKENDGMLIVEALKRGSNIHTLNLSRNKFKAMQFIAILDALQHHRSLHTLVLDQTYKGTSDDISGHVATALALIVNQNENIRALSVSGSFQSVAPQFLSKLSPTAKLEELDISNNQLRDQGASCITKALRRNENLKILFLDDNLISYTGWQTILQIFSTNKKLERIPFPWRDYHRLGTKQGSTEECKVRQVLIDIQEMCSRNFQVHNDPGMFPDEKMNYFLSLKDTIRVDFDAPTKVAPLATVPGDIVDDGDDENFTFANDSSDEGITEFELVELQNTGSRVGSTKFSSRARVSKFSDEEDYDDEDVFAVSDSFDSDNDAPPLPDREAPPLPSRALIDDESVALYEIGIPAPGKLPNLPTQQNSVRNSDEFAPVDLPNDPPPPIPSNITDPGDDDFAPAESLASSVAPPIPTILQVAPQTLPQRPKNPPQFDLSEQTSGLLPLAPTNPPPVPSPANNPLEPKRESREQSCSEVVPPLPERDAPAPPSASLTSPPKSKKRKTSSSGKRSRSSSKETSKKTSASSPRSRNRKKSLGKVDVNSEKPKKRKESKLQPVRPDKGSEFAASLAKQKNELKVAHSVPSVKDYVFSDDEESSEDNGTPVRAQSEIFSQSMDCDSIGELLSRVMGERREFIEKDNFEDDCDDYSSDDDSW